MQRTTNYGRALHRVRAAAAACAFGGRVEDAETTAVQVFVVVDRNVGQVHQAALVDDDGDAVELVKLVELRVELGVEVELVLEARAAAADDAHAEIDLLRSVRRLLLLGDDPLDLAGGFLGDRDRHGLLLMVTGFRKSSRA